jgi:3-dehydroquinate synthase
VTISIPVQLANRSYTVEIGQGLLAQAGERIKTLHPSARIAIVCDETIAALHLGVLEASLQLNGISHTTIIIPPGEAQKSFSGLEALSNALLASELDRGDLVVALGGGVIGDLAGFTAGILKRGLDFVQIPTTLLAQVDSSVGGKTAINAPAGKNLIGLFWQPKLVLADIDVLATLPDRERRAGWAEVVKYGLINDPEFFEWCHKNAAAALSGDVAAMTKAVQVSVESKARIVAADEREAGERALLNLGHTFAHAFESCAGWDEGILLHGEAVACGMAMAHRFSAHLGFCPTDEARLAAEALANARLETDPKKLPGAPWDAEELLQAMAHDKKNEGGKLTLILTRGIGKAFVMKDAPTDALLDFLKNEVTV